MKTDVTLFHKSKINQALCAIAASQPAFIYGTCIGWMSPMSLLLQSNDKSLRDEPMTDTEISWMASLPYLVSIPFYYLLAYIGDNFGRKLTLLLISVIGSVVWILKLCSTKSWVLITARSLVSVVMAGAFVTCPVYLKEISDNSIRGTLGCCIIIFFTMGELFAYIIGNYLSYNVIVLVCLSISLASTPLLFLIPESPSYLIKKNKITEAHKVLHWLRRMSTEDNVIQREIELLQREQKNDQYNENLIKTIVSDKILFKAFQISLVAVLSREFCGAVPVINFAGIIFTNGSVESKPFLEANVQAIVLGTVQCIGSIVASTIVEKTGRKCLLFTTCLISSLSMFCLATWFSLKKYGLVGPAWIPILTLCICIFCDAAGLLSLGTVITGEIFSFKYRSAVLGITMAIASLLDFIQLLIFNYVTNYIGIESSFYSFGSMCFLTALYVIFVVPETKARPLDEIYEELKCKKNKKTTVIDVTDIK